MSWGVAGLAIIAIFVIITVKLSQKNGSQKKEGEATEYPYQRREALFTPAERSFLGVLNQAVGEEAQIFGKIRVADVITPRKGMPRSDWQKAFNKIAAKHFDYLLCDKNDLSVLCAVELNDSSHNKKRQNDRDEFLRKACQAAAFPLIQITGKAAYNVNEIRESLAGYLPGREPRVSTEDPVDSTLDQELQADEKTCPKCSSRMVKKIARDGKGIGDQFWDCTAFPLCRYTEAIEGSDFKEMEVSS